MVRRQSECDCPRSGGSHSLCLLTQRLGDKSTQHFGGKIWYNSHVMNEGLKDKIARYLTYAALLLIVVGGTVMMYPNYRRSEALKRQNAELQERIDEKKREIAQLMDYQRRFRTDADFVETIARQNHRVFPGELVFIFEKD